MNQATAIQRAEYESVIERHEPAPAELTVQEIVARVDKVREVQRKVMTDGQHYGIVPGTPKPSLWKPGAEILGMVFRLDPQFESTETRDGDHLTVNVKCTLYHQPSGQRIGSGLGSCSTKESKYAFRNAWESVNGKQVKKSVANDKLADQYNTVLKMAVKRAHVAAILFATCASEIFTQDLEDMADVGHAPQPAKAKPKPAATKSAPAADDVVRVHFGKNEGTPITELSDSSLDWYITAARENIADPKKANYLVKNKAWLEHLLDERDARADDTSEPSEAEAEVVHGQYDE
jgi:hypothetical protein